MLYMNLVTSSFLLLVVMPLLLVAMRLLLVAMHLLLIVYGFYGFVPADDPPTLAPKHEARHPLLSAWS